VTFAMMCSCKHLTIHCFLATPESVTLCVLPTSNEVVLNMIVNTFLKLRVTKKI